MNDTVLTHQISQHESKINEMGLSLEELTKPDVQYISLVINRAVEKRIRDLEASRRRRFSSNMQKITEIIGLMNPDASIQEPHTPVNRQKCPRLYE